MRVVLFGVMVVSAFLNGQANAGALRGSGVDPMASDPYYTLSPMQTELVSSEETVLTAEEAEKWIARSEIEKNDAPELKNQVWSVGADPLSIIDVVLRAWALVEAGKPVTNVQMKSASALPVLSDGDFRKLVGWMPLRTATYHVFASNGYGLKVVDFTYQVRLMAGGNVRGTGRYIGIASVVPVNTKVLWGFGLESSVNIPQVINMGTEEDPLAGIFIDVNYNIHGTFRDQSETVSYALRGDGYMEDLTEKKVLFEAAERTAVPKKNSVKKIKINGE